MTRSDDDIDHATTKVLGDPPLVIAKFFDDIGPDPKRVLDIGCGRGKEALFIASLGHEVLAVDRSLNRIRDLNAVARQEKLNINVEIANIVSFEPAGLFDVVIIDRCLKQLSEYDRLMVLNKLIDYIRVGGWLLVAEGKDNFEHFCQILNTHESRWIIDRLKEGYLFACRLEE